MYATIMFWQNTSCASDAVHFPEQVKINSQFVSKHTLSEIPPSKKKSTHQYLLIAKNPHENNKKIRPK